MCLFFLTAVCNCAMVPLDWWQVVNLHNGDDDAVVAATVNGEPHAGGVNQGDEALDDVQGDGHPD